MRRLALIAAACAIPAAAVALFVACDDNGTVLGAPDATADVSTVDVFVGPDGSDGGLPEEASPTPDAADETELPDACGDGPWVTLGILVVKVDLFDIDASTPLPGASFTSPLCPALVKTSNEAGVITGQISKDVPFYGRLQAPGEISELAPEEMFDADSTGNKIEMLPLIAESFVGYDGGGTAIVIAGLALDKDAGACSTLDGISISVPGHPEAEVVYLSPEIQPIVDASATSTRGFAAILGLAGGQLVTLSATKPGCQVIFARAPLTGRVPLENGFVSLMPAYLSP